MEQWQERLDHAVKEIEEGSIKEGLHSLEKIHDEAFYAPLVLLQLVSIYHSLGHHTTALSILDEIDELELEQDEEMRVETQIFRASTYMDLDQTSEALDILMNLKETVKDDYRVFALLGEVFVIEGLPEVAIRYLEQALKLDESQEEIRYLLGKLYAEQGEHSRALSEWESINGFDNDERLLLERAAMVAKDGEFEDALQLYDRTLSISDRSVEALYGYGMVAFQLGNWMQAIPRLAKLLEVDREYIPAYSLLAECLVKAGFKDKAAEVYRQGLNLHVEEDTLVPRYMELLCDLQRWNEMNDWIDHMDEIDEDDPSIWYWQGRIAEGQGDTEMAVERYGRVLDSGEDLFDTSTRYSHLIRH
ncbi:tetratricopeptide repeat protein [Aneurinibacillus sp. Ricciae_BoGa-3]|uniref:tetratricopeptide repeat protein n=1 Tax=Aneurinibacillus sp. Ricciae_BoGa-3 TaxID=3022697 RepID=UPI002340622E|nr:tetratricopeptide repeat protein [Aneurinibacillus sp. Ricciae_BoGa-3]WCK56095.1 tetratricopeptide repeat protein [Aneurinibacillus sp. Ricciae_BoGa-3]